MSLNVKSYQDRLPAMKVPLSGTMRDAVLAISRGELGLAIVVDQHSDKFLGLITDGDVRRSLLLGKDDSTKIENILNRDVVTVIDGTVTEEISELFTSAVRAIPILDKQGSGLVVDLAYLDKRFYIPASEPYLSDRELKYVVDCVSSGWISSAGSYVEKFESLVSDACNVEYGVSTTNGTSALHLALSACGVGPGDEVIVPDITFIATGSAVCHTGAKPIFVDVEQSSWCMNPDLLNKVITPSTKAIVPVHLYGHPARMDKILDIARKNHLWVIEDAAEAQGAKFRGDPVGSFGDIAIFSFYGNKTITTGEGGMAVTNHQELAEKMRLLRGHGMDPDRPYWHTVLGFNYRMTNLQAAVGVGQMEKFDEILGTKLTIAKTYSRLLSKVPGIILPTEEVDVKHSYWMYTVLVDEAKALNSRDQVLSVLQDEGIEARPSFPPMHKQPVFEAGGTFPIAEQVASTGLSLPSFVSMNDRDLEKISSVIKSAVRR